jgi:microcystin-dependent protein
MEYYTGSIEFFAAQYAPPGFRPCDGTVYAIKAFEALYSIIGTTFGGDGRANFAMPDLCGRLAVGEGRNPIAEKTYQRGESAGQERTTLTVEQMPSHDHDASAGNITAQSTASVTKSEVTSEGTVHVASTPGGQNSPYQNVFGPTLSGGNYAASASQTMAPDAIEVTTTLYNLEIEVATIPSLQDLALEPTGKGLPFTLMQPVLGLNPLIFVVSPTYPPRP